MKNNRRQAQFLLRSITDDVPQLLLEENNFCIPTNLRLVKIKFHKHRLNEVHEVEPDT